MVIRSCNFRNFNWNSSLDDFQVLSNLKSQRSYKEIIIFLNKDYFMQKEDLMKRFFRNNYNFFKTYKIIFENNGEIGNIFLIVINF